MGFTCGFFNSKGHDRKYDADQLSAIFDGIIKDGVFDSIGKAFSVVPNTSMSGRLAVTVNEGKAWFDHTWNLNDSQIPLTLDGPDVTLTRYDAVILETNHTDPIRNNSIKIKKGIPASNPTKPKMSRSKDINQYPFAYVRIRPQATAITSSDIEIVVGRGECPFVTGIIDSIDITDLFNQWQGDFDTWFDNVKDQMSGNVVGNLQKQIDERVRIADKATSSHAVNSGDDIHWMTPKGVSLAVEAKSFEVGDVRNSARDLESISNGKYLLCDGRSLSRSSYASLFNAIRDRYGFESSISQLASYNKVEDGFGHVYSLTNSDNTRFIVCHKSSWYSRVGFVVKVYSVASGAHIRTITMPNEYTFRPNICKGSMLYGTGSIANQSDVPSKTISVNIDTGAVNIMQGGDEDGVIHACGVSTYDNSVWYAYVSRRSSSEMDTLRVTRISNGLVGFEKILYPDFSGSDGFIFNDKVYLIGKENWSISWTYDPKERGISGGSITSISNSNMRTFVDRVFSKETTYDHNRIISYSPDGSYMVGAGYDGCVYTINTRYELKKYIIVSNSAIGNVTGRGCHLQVSNDGAITAYTVYDKGIYYGYSAAGVIWIQELVEQNINRHKEDNIAIFGNDGYSGGYGIMAYVKYVFNSSDSRHSYDDEYLKMHRCNFGTFKIPIGPHSVNGPGTAYIRAK